ncbi:MAG: DUF4296 domain-containing protein [Flavitalea sp.]
MMRLPGLIVFLLLVFTSCTDKEKVPEDIIAPVKMEKVMWDMIQADRFAATFIIRDSAKVNVTDETFKMYDRVFQVHKISKDEFVRSFKFYLDRPDISKKMFDSLVSYGQKKKPEVYIRDSQ